MSKNDFIESLISAMGNDQFGPGRLRKMDSVQWMQRCKDEVRRLSKLTYSELEMLYRKSEGLYDVME